MQINFLDVIFYAYAALTLLAALMVVLQNHPVRSVLFLVLTFFGAAGLWMMQQAEFLSLILILVYVGAVMTLFLFVVMMLHVDVEAIRSHLMRLLPFGVVVVAALAGLFGLALSHTAFAPVLPTENALSNTEQIGMLLYTQYVYPLEIAAVILLVAMISAITLTHRALVRSKRQNIRSQIMTDPKTRVRLVAMSSTKEKTS